MQTNGSVSAEKDKHFKNTNYKSEMLKIEDCLLDGYGNYDSIVETLRKQLLDLTILQPRDQFCQMVAEVV